MSIPCWKEEHPHLCYDLMKVSMGHNPYTNTSCPQLWAEPLPPWSLSLIPSDSHCCSVAQMVCVDGRAGQEVLEKAGFTHALQGMRHCSHTRCSPPFSPPRQGSVLLEGLNRGTHQIATLIAIWFR